MYEPPPSDMVIQAGPQLPSRDISKPLQKRGSGGPPPGPMLPPRRSIKDDTPPLPPPPTEVLRPPLPVPPKERTPSPGRAPPAAKKNYVDVVTKPQPSRPQPRLPILVSMDV